MTTTHRPADPRRRVAVLGGTGWVGRHVCAALAGRGGDGRGGARPPAPPHPAGHTTSVVPPASRRRTTSISSS
ncbi:hypothetical protein ACFV16_15845, partial [Streptomyces massasporeus]